MHGIENRISRFCIVRPFLRPDTPGLQEAFLYHGNFQRYPGLSVDKNKQRRIVKGFPCFFFADVQSKGHINMPRNSYKSGPYSNGFHKSGKKDRQIVTVAPSVKQCLMGELQIIDGLRVFRQFDIGTVRVYNVIEPVQPQGFEHPHSKLQICIEVPPHPVPNYSRRVPGKPEHRGVGGRNKSRGLPVIVPGHCVPVIQ